MAITRVWVEPGGVLFGSSAGTCPAVFEVTRQSAPSSEVKPDVDFTQYKEPRSSEPPNCVQLRRSSARSLNSGDGVGASTALTKLAGGPVCAGYGRSNPRCHLSGS